MSDLGEHSNTGNLSEESCSWKSKLSGAYNDEQIFFSLLLLSIFYVGYTAAKADFDADNTSIDNEERFIQSCYCSTHQRSFFRSWFLLFCVIWLIIHSYTFFTQVFAKSCPSCEKIITGLLTIGSVCSEFTCLYPCMKIQSCVIGDPDNNHNQLKIPKFPKVELERKIRLLWYQYCKLYVVGYTHEMDNEKQKDEDQTDNKEKGCCTNQSSQQKDDCVCCNAHITCPTINIKCCNQYFPSAKGIIRGFLFLVKYVSQLVTVPLLLLQIFDTYSLLCFSPDLYCSRTSEYKLHLAQAAITLLFYCSLALSQLVSTLLTWNPWPQTNK